MYVFFDWKSSNVLGVTNKWSQKRLLRMIGDMVGSYRWFLCLSSTYIHTHICDSVVWLNLIFLCCHFRLMIMNDWCFVVAVVVVNKTNKKNRVQNQKRTETKLCVIVFRKWRHNMKPQYKRQRHNDDDDDDDSSNSWHPTKWSRS